MYESQIGEYKFEIDKLNKELTEVKDKYFMQKKREQLLKERERLEAVNGGGGSPSGTAATSSHAGPSIVPNRSVNDQVRYVGGGFSLKTPSTTKANA